ncbi:galactosidase [Pectobacterium polaris]|uniref:glycoside hydrolase family 53 protein n=1 Tax=Pectobacterium TaxID=122277 RepID=UPI0015826359|nr:galactosidase [Pectobacterium polaris]
MKMKKRVLMAAMFATGLLTVSLPQTLYAAENVTINKLTNVPADFIKGADISMLNEVEKHGGKFYDEHGKQKDAMLILKENGINYIRLRIWNDPKDAAGNGYGGGNNDLATTLALAKRAKANGMKVLLDFHYSDFWTDPAHQNKPKAWSGLNVAQLTTAVHDYTKATISEFQKAGVMPDMVQIGNELNGGMLWPEGKSWGQGGGEFDRLAALLKAGIQGVKDVQGANNVKIMLHLAEGTKNDTFIWWFDEIVKRNVPFDVIGASFYTYWNGPISALQYNMNDVTKRYNKDIIVVEAAYAYTLENCDNAENSFQQKELDAGGYPASVQGQANYLHDLMQSVINVPNQRGKGVFYWEPIWLPTPGATWATKAGMKYNNDEWKEGNARENQALFDCKGNVLPSIKAFK